MQIGIFLGIAVVCFVLYFIISVSSSGLQSKFGEIGNLKGLTKQEIIDIVGPPMAIQSMPDGKVLLQWHEGGYHIALLFSNDVCEGITSEISA